MRAPILFIALVVLSGTADARGSILYAGRSWAAIDRGDVCEALGRSARVAAKGKIQASAGFAFSADRKRWGEFRARLRRMPRAGATVMLRVGNQPFLLVSRGNLAWSAGPRQDRAIIAALRGATGMTIESRDMAGRRFVDPYSLSGAPTAIDAAAAACAGKKQRR